MHLYFMKPIFCAALATVTMAATHTTLTMLEAVGDETASNFPPKDSISESTMVSFGRDIKASGLVANTTRFSLAMLDSGVNSPNHGINTIKIHQSPTEKFAIVVGKGNPAMSKIDISNCDSSVAVCGSVLWTATLNNEPYCADIDPSGSYAIVCNYVDLRYVPLDQPEGSSFAIETMKKFYRGSYFFMGIKISPDGMFAIANTYGGRVLKIDLKTASYDVKVSSGYAPGTHVLGSGKDTEQLTDGCGKNADLGKTHYTRAVEFLDTSTFIIGGWYGGRMLFVDTTSFCTTTIVPVNSGLGTAGFAIHPSGEFGLSTFDNGLYSVQLTSPYMVTFLTPGSTSATQIIDGTHEFLLGSQFSTSGRRGHMGGIAYSSDGSYALMAFPGKSILKISFLEPTAGGGGDPHFSAFGDIFFSWQGHCDAILARIPGRNIDIDDTTEIDLEIQIRTRKVRRWSSIDVVAVKAGQYVLEIGSEEGKLLLNGTEVESVLDKDSLIVSSTRIKKRIILYQFIFDGDKKLEVKVNIRSRMVFVTLSGNYPEDTVGLIGSPGRPGLFARGGRDMTGKDVNKFVESWQVRDDDPQLFLTARAPQFPAKCLYTMQEMKESTAVVSSLWSHHRRLKETRAVTAEEANNACAIHDPGPLKTFCVKDIVATGDFESAQDEFYG